MVNSATGKIMCVASNTIPSECPYCSDIQPSYIDVEFTDLSIFTGCCPLQYQHTYDKKMDSSQSWSDSDVNGIFRLPHKSGCIYELVVPRSTLLTKVYWSIHNVPCEHDSPYYSIADGYLIRAELLETGVKIESHPVVIISGSYGDVVFSATIPYSPDESCGDTGSNTAPNEYTGCMYNNTAMCLCAGSGVAKIKTIIM
jgi:hypothetical protein